MGELGTRGYLLTEEQAEWIRGRLTKWVGWPSQWPQGVAQALDGASAANYLRVEYAGRGAPMPYPVDFDDEDGAGDA